MKFEIAGGAMVINAPEDPERYVMSHARVNPRPEPTITFDGVVRPVVDFVEHVRDLGTHVLFLKNRVTELENELNPQGDAEFLGEIDYGSPEGKDIRLRNQRREIIRQRGVIEQLLADKYTLKERVEYEVGRTGERVREVTQLQEALRQKNEIIKEIREKVAEARIYE